MTQLDARFVIVGGGLAGLYASHELERQGISDHVLLEARPSLGGRIQSLTHQSSCSLPARAAPERFDLGPTWFWPAFQPELDQLVTTLGLTRFEQFETGDMVLERSPNEPPVRTTGYINSLASMRLVGGMAALVDALHGRLTGGRIIVDRPVRELRREGDHVVVVSADAAGHLHELRAQQVLLAMPPRLVHKHIGFSPELPASLARQWQDTGTWMAPHAKYVAIYDKPFWRELGLSGEARSARGPMGEIHDASMPGGCAALFGFLGVRAAVRPCGVACRKKPCSATAAPSSPGCLVRRPPRPRLSSSKTGHRMRGRPLTPIWPHRLRTRRHQPRWSMEAIGRAASRVWPANGRLSSPATSPAPSKLRAWACKPSFAMGQRPCNP